MTCVRGAESVLIEQRLDAVVEGACVVCDLVEECENLFKAVLRARRRADVGRCERRGLGGRVVVVRGF
jgi:hypothetical protein